MPGELRDLASDDHSLTQEGSAVGTPAFMSPEQTRGEREITQGSDIWSLGVILYQLLTGELPFFKESHLSTLRAVEKDVLIPLRRLDATIPKDLDAICQKCLRKSTTDRYESAFQLSQDLNNWIDGRPVSARPVTKIQTLTRWAKRNPLLSAALVFAFLSLATGLSVATWQWKASRSHLATSNVQRDRAQRHVIKLDQTIDFVLDQYSEKISTNRKLDPTQIKILTRMMTVQKQLLQDETDHLVVRLDTIKNYKRLCQICRLLGEFDHVEEFSDVAFKLIDSVPESHKDSSDIQMQKLDLLYVVAMAKKDHSTPDDARKVLAKIEPILKDQQLTFPKSERSARWFSWHRHMAILFLLEHRVGDALKSQNQAATYLLQLIADEPEDANWKQMHLNLLIGTAKIHVGRRNYIEAEKGLNELLERFESLSPEHKDKFEFGRHAAAAHSEIGHMLRIQGKNELALDRFEKAVDLYGKHYESNPKEVNSGLVHSLVRVVETGLAMNHFEKANVACDRALDVVIMLRPNGFQAKTHVNLLKLKAELAMTGDNNLAAARAYIQEAIALGIKSAEKRPHDVVQHVALLQSFEAKERIELDAGNEAIAAEATIKSFNCAKTVFSMRPQSTTNQSMLVELANRVSHNYLKQCEVREAIGIWEQLIALDKNQSRFHYASAFRLTRSVKEIAENPDAFTGEDPFPTIEQREFVRNFVLDHLKQAIDLGLDKTRKNSLTSAPDWELWRDDAEFQELMGKVKSQEDD